MRLPDFLIIGAQKSGTTWLAEQLRAHSRIYMPSGELHFFDRPDHYARGIEWYASQFQHAGEDRLAGEKTPNYLFMPDSPHAPDGAHRIARHLPNVRLIAVLRDPVRRAVSAVNHMIRDGIVSPLRSVDHLLGRHCHQLPWLVLEPGVYARQLAVYFELFSRDRMLVLYYEDDVVASPEASIQLVCNFLGLAAEYDPDRLAMRANTKRRCRPRLVLDRYVPPARRWTHNLDRWFAPFIGLPSEKTIRRLYDHYAPHNEELFRLLGRRPKSGWSFSSLPPGS